MIFARISSRIEKIRVKNECGEIKDSPVDRAFTLH